MASGEENENFYSKPNKNKLHNNKIDSDLTNSISVY